MNADAEEWIKGCPICVDFQATQLKDKAMSHEIPARLCELVRADIFTVNNKYFCTVDYNSKSQVVQQVEDSVR